MLTNRTILGVRGVLLWALRGLGVGLLGYGLFIIGARLMYGLLGTGDLVAAWRAWEGIGTGHGLFRGVPMGAVGLALTLASRPLARWVVCTPDAGCPGCGYAGSGGAGARCPECGRLDGAARPSDASPA